MSFPPRVPMPVPGIPPTMVPPYPIPPMAMIPWPVGMMPMPMINPFTIAVPPPAMVPYSPSTAALVTPSAVMTVPTEYPQKLTANQTPAKREVNSADSETYRGPPINVFLGNITKSAPDVLIRKILQTCGTVLNWNRVKGPNGQLEAFGFCSYKDPQSAWRCIRLLHGLEIGDRKLVVKADPKTMEKLTEYEAEQLDKQRKSTEHDSEKSDRKNSEGTKVSTTEDLEEAENCDNEKLREETWKSDSGEHKEGGKMSNYLETGKEKSTDNALSELSSSSDVEMEILDDERPGEEAERSSTEKLGGKLDSEEYEKSAKVSDDPETGEEKASGNAGDETETLDTENVREGVAKSDADVHQEEAEKLDDHKTGEATVSHNPLRELQNKVDDTVRASIEFLLKVYSSVFSNPAEISDVPLSPFTPNIHNEGKSSTRSNKVRPGPKLFCEGSKKAELDEIDPANVKSLNYSEAERSRTKAEHTDNKRRDKSRSRKRDSLSPESQSRHRKGYRSEKCSGKFHGTGDQRRDVDISENVHKTVSDRQRERRRRSRSQSRRRERESPESRSRHRKRDSSDSSHGRSNYTGDRRRNRYRSRSRNHDSANRRRVGDRSESEHSSHSNTTDRRRYADRRGNVRNRDRDSDRDRRSSKKDREGRRIRRSRERDHRLSRSPQYTGEREHDTYREEETYERRKETEKLANKQAMYEERLCAWEAREKRKMEEREREKERVENEKRKVTAYTRRLKQFLEDYDDLKDDANYYRGNAFEKRMGQRLKEIEEGNRDKLREAEELKDPQNMLVDEYFPETESEVSKPPPVKPEKLEALQQLPSSNCEPTPRTVSHEDTGVFDVSPEDTGILDQVSIEKPLKNGFPGLVTKEVNAVGCAGFSSGSISSATTNNSHIGSERNTVMPDVFKACDKKREATRPDDDEDERNSRIESKRNTVMADIFKACDEEKASMKRKATPPDDVEDERAAQRDKEKLVVLNDNKDDESAMKDEAEKVEPVDKISVQKYTKNETPQDGFYDLVTKEVTKPIRFTAFKFGTNSSVSTSTNDCGVVSKRKMIVPNVFSSCDEEETAQNKKRKLVRLDDEKEEASPTKKRKASPLVRGDEEIDKKKTNVPLTVEEKKMHIRNLIENIPTAKDELFAYNLDLSVVDGDLMEKRIRPWINKKIVQYIGEEIPTLLDFISSKITDGSKPQLIVDDLSNVLDDEAEMFVIKLWRMLIYVVKAKSLGLEIPSQEKTTLGRQRK